LNDWKQLDQKKHKLYESAFIKSIRRGLVDDAVYWGTLLDKFGHAHTVWRRMFIHLSEDIGLADRNLPANVDALYSNFKMLVGMQKASFETDHTERLPYVHAIVLLATAKKSRDVDNVVSVYYQTNKDREVPDYAYDLHSPLGRRMGRDISHFYNEAALINDGNDLSAHSAEWERVARTTKKD